MNIEPIRSRWSRSEQYGDNGSSQNSDIPSWVPVYAHQFYRDYTDPKYSRYR